MPFNRYQRDKWRKKQNVKQLVVYLLGVIENLAENAPKVNCL